MLNYFEMKKSSHTATTSIHAGLGHSYVHLTLKLRYFGCLQEKSSSYFEAFSSASSEKKTDTAEISLPICLVLNVLFICIIKW